MADIIAAKSSTSPPRTDVQLELPQQEYVASIAPGAHDHPRGFLMIVLDTSIVITTIRRIQRGYPRDDRLPWAQSA
jgi:hypothetical protein